MYQNNTKNPSESEAKSYADAAIDILSHARGYAGKGLAVFPCGLDKKPLTSHGFKDASTDPETISSWWAQYPESSIGWAVPESMLVLDIDLPEGPETLKKLEAIHGPLPATRTQQTGSGGFQYFFRLPKGVTAKNSARKIGPGIDTRSLGGYVILPPSGHPSGGTYKWIDEREAAVCPGWILEALNPKEAPRNESDQQRSCDSSHPYIRKAVDGELQTLLSAGEGGRNNALNTAAAKLGSFVGGGCLSESEAYDMLLNVALVIGLPEHEARQTIKSGLAAGMRSPRGIPEEDSHRSTRANHSDNFKEAIEKNNHQDESCQWDAVIPMDAQEVDKIDPNTLPGFIGEYAQAVARETETPIEMAAGMLFVSIAACVQGKIKIIVKPGYSEPLSFWAFTPMPPATRKSQILKRVTAPLSDWERRKRAEMEPIIKARRIDRENIQARIKALRGKLGKAKRDELSGISDEIKELENSIEPELVAPQVWAQDTTPENAGQIMARNSERITILAAEGGILDTLGGRYSAGVANLDLFLQSYSGDAVKVNRTTRDDIYLNAPALSMGLMPQPDVLRGMAARPEFKGRGFTGRPIYFMPASNLGRRTFNSEPIPERVKISYAQTIEKLLEIQPIEHQDGTIEQHTLTLSKEAYAEWLDFALYIEHGLADGERFEHCRGWAGKTQGRAARLAGLLHCAMNPVEPWLYPVTLETMDQALNITQVSISHAMAVFNLMGADQAIESAGRVLKWIKRQGHHTFTKKQAFDALRGTFTKSNMLDEPLGILVERNYIRPIVETEKKPGRKSEGYEVNPTIQGGM